MAARVGAAGGTSTARRRRERRLRSWAKQERLSVAMALAEKLHHSANRTVLPKKEEVGHHYAPRGQKPARAGPGTQYFSLGDESVPERVGEPQLQARVQRHYLEDTSKVCLFLQILALPVQQMVDTVLEFFRLLEFPVAEYPRSPRHRVLLGRFSVNRRWRNSWSQCRRCSPMPCSSSGMWSKLLTFQFLVMVPVEVFKVFSRTWFRTACCGTEPWSWCSWWSSWFATELVSANCGTDRRHSCPWYWWLSSPVPGERPDYGRLQGSVAGQSSTARRGAHLHELLPDDVVDEELQERMAAHVLLLERTRSVVLFSQQGPSCMMKVAGGGLGLCRALMSLTSSATALARCASSSRTRRRRTPCASAGLSSKLSPSTPPHAGEFVGGPLSSLTTILRLRTCW